VCNVNLVDGLVWSQEAVGSNPTTQTKVLKSILSSSINIFMIISQYINDWRLLSCLTATFPYTQEEVYEALQKEEYQGEDYRRICNEIKSPILQEIHKTVTDNIPSLVEGLTKFSDFVEHWGLDDINTLTSNLKTFCKFICDKPGFTTGIHIDNKSQVCTGMLFFNETDDPAQSTSFYTSLNGDNPLRISSQYGNGWFSANTYWGYHIGANNSQRDRYALLFISSLDLK
jgi:hypothetical protein